MDNILKRDILDMFLNPILISFFKSSKLSFNETAFSVSFVISKWTLFVNKIISLLS